MKPAPPDRSIPKLRPLRSLYSRDAATGKREDTPTKLIDRKRMFKPHPNVLTFKKNTAFQGKNIARRSQSIINSRDSTRMAKAINSAAGMGRFPQLGGLFLRPSIDVRNFHNQIMERAKRLDETLQTDEEELKIAQQANLKVPTNKVCTPKPSGLSRAYIKLSESKKKLTAPSISASPFEENNIVGRTKLDTSEVNNRSEGNLLDDKSVAKSNTFTYTKVKENHLVAGTISDEKHLSIKFSTNIESEERSKVGNENITQFALNNILKHCQLYTSNMMNVNKAMDILDDAFQRVMILEIGGHLHARFCEYQNRKLQLYKKMEVLEKELEKSVKDEVDVSSRFTDYLTEKRSILKDCTRIQENFENLVHQMIQSYEKEIVDSAPRSHELEDILKELISAKRGCDYKKREPVLRRSKRLLATPKLSDAECEGTTVDRREKNDLLVKRCSKSYDRKRIQTCIYKDLQKSFNLCSPECSF